MAYSINPINDFYFRQANNFQPYNPVNQNQSQFLTRYVSNIEEAKASFVDPYITYLFLDSSCGKIYLKRMKNDGTSEFISFSTDEKFNNAAKENSLEEIEQRLTNIEKILGGINNVQSVSGNADVQQSNGNNAKSVVAENAAGQSANVSADTKSNKWQKWNRIKDNGGKYRKGKGNWFSKVC